MKFLSWNIDGTSAVLKKCDFMDCLWMWHAHGSGVRRKVLASTFVRSTNVIKESRKRANGICQLCGCSAPFNDKKGDPYLEVHHVKWLSKGGEDSTNNTVALCPNCHTKIHVLNAREDEDKLFSTVNAY